MELPVKLLMFFSTIKYALAARAPEQSVVSATHRATACLERAATSTRWLLLSATNRRGRHVRRPRQLVGSLLFPLSLSLSPSHLYFFLSYFLALLKPPTMSGVLTTFSQWPKSHTHRRASITTYLSEHAAAVLIDSPVSASLLLRTPRRQLSSRSRSFCKLTWL